MFRFQTGLFIGGGAKILFFAPGAGYLLDTPLHSSIFKYMLVFRYLAILALLLLS